ncbi:MAG: hypothetical protein A2Y17_06170 [Clostridiales bacterium GWF2_38_85]|nr:MAG: hypothetical protein A2Y17_06170 [Clostridiales bacterium GWF2_38_85]HBL85478.1 GNAT family N-acetyltransferase [Clostridiales bacterium]
MSNIKYRIAKQSDIDKLIKLMLLLYKNTSYEELLAEIEPDIESNNFVFFLALDNGKFVGFSHCAVRHDYVEGTNGGNVGYLEGIFVLPEYRRKGIAKHLLALCEGWSREKGCKEFASDCEIGNTESYNFHIKMNFSEANRVICFAKRIDDQE